MDRLEVDHHGNHLTLLGDIDGLAPRAVAGCADDQLGVLESILVFGLARAAIEPIDDAVAIGVGVGVGPGRLVWIDWRDRRPATCVDVWTIRAISR